MSGARRFDWVKAAGFCVASNVAVLFVLRFGQWFWPEGLPAHSHNAFWLASGVNVAGLLVLGLRYWPVILLDAFPAWLLAGESLEVTLPGSVTNAMEAAMAAWLIGRWGGFAGGLDRIRPVGALLVASLVAPMINTVVIPAWFCARGIVPWSEYWRAVGNWNLSNGASMLIVGSLLVCIARGKWELRGRSKEFGAFAVVAAGLCGVAFNALFAGAGMNFAFIVFPVVIYAAVRFGTSEVALTLAGVLVAIYGSLAAHAHSIPGTEMAAAIWFVQAFCWVLAATGLVVAALVGERRKAEREVQAERERVLEMSLNEERARLDALRYQINPHFLFNSLNSISATLPCSGAEVSRRMVSQLAGYLRSTLAGDDTDTVALREELNSLRQYLEIEKSRFGEDLQVSIDAEEGALGRRVPVFLLQPLVENAIVHGFSTTKGVFRLEIVAELRGEKLWVEVANTGVWRGPEGAGVGLKNTRRRLELLFGAEGRLDVETAGGWVRVKIEMPARGTEV